MIAYYATCSVFPSRHPIKHARTQVAASHDKIITCQCEINDSVFIPSHRLASFHSSVSE